MEKADIAKTTPIHSAIPNAILFQHLIINYTLDQEYMLDEVPVRLTFDSPADGKVDESQVQEALASVFDPEIPVNIVDLGLIYQVEIEQETGQVTVDMTLTAPACPVAGTLPKEVGRVIDEVPGVTNAVVKLVWNPPWSQDLLSEEAQLELGLL